MTNLSGVTSVQDEQDELRWRPFFKSYKDYAVHLGTEVQLVFRFYVTSFTVSLKILGRLCPEATSFHDFEIKAVDPSAWYTVALGGWHDNDADPGEKYGKAAALVRQVAGGDWSNLRTQEQSNRSSGYSLDKGETVRFWSAATTRPELAQEKIKFPLPVPAELAGK